MKTFGNYFDCICIIMKVKELILQFVKYCFAGGVAFVFDFLTLTFIHMVVFTNFEYSVYLGTAVGFIVGTLINYLISKKLVFVTNSAYAKRTSIEFIVFLLIGLFGLFITELGMFVGTQMLRVSYVITKILMAIIVLAWNFVARRILLYGR